MLVEINEKDLRKSISLYIETFNEKPVNFIKILKIGKILKFNGFTPIYLYNDRKQTIEIDITEII